MAKKQTLKDFAFSKLEWFTAQLLKEDSNQNKHYVVFGPLKNNISGDDQFFHVVTKETVESIEKIDLLAEKAYKDEQKRLQRQADLEKKIKDFKNTILALIATAYFVMSSSYIILSL